VIGTLYKKSEKVKKYFFSKNNHGQKAEMGGEGSGEGK
jgi:hypothetical protein